MRRFFYYNSSFASGFPNEYSMLFDGVDEYINLGRITDIESVANISFSAWIKPDLSTTFYPFGKRSNSNNEINVLVGTGGAVVLRFSSGSVAGGDSAAGIVLNNLWQHITIVFDGGGATNSDRLKLYINGSLISLTYTGTIPALTTASIQPFAIGAIGNATSSNANGNIDEFSIFNYSLNSSQVSTIYNSGSPTDLLNTTGVTPPVHWWRMGDGDTWGGSSWTINDVGTLGTNNGTSVNMEQADRVTDVP